MANTHGTLPDQQLNATALSSLMPVLDRTLAGPW